MIKRMIILGLVLCTGFSMRAQDRRVHPLQSGDLAYAFGIKGGLSFSDMSLKDWYPQANAQPPSRQGICLGIVYHKPLNSQWAFQPELVYASQGYRMQSSGPGWSYRDVVRQGYFNLPLLVQYVSPVGLSLYTGPQPGWLVFNRRDDFTAMDLSWVVGGAYFLKNGLGAEVRYNAGITDIASNRYADLAPTFKARNRVVQASIVYLFARAKKRAS